MSDGALSQDEIDALLAGVDSSSLGGLGGGSSSGGSSSQSNGESKVLQDLLEGTISTLSSNFSMLTGVSVSLTGPQVVMSDRDAFLQKLPDTVCAVKADLTAGFPGEHLYLINEDTARKIASLMNKEDNIDLDEMALSVVGEVFSQMSGSQITEITNKTGNKTVASMSPQVTNVPKAVVALPGGNFQAATYQIDFGDGFKAPLWEVFSAQISSGLNQSLSAPKGGAAPSNSSNGFNSMDLGNMGGMQGMSMPNMGMPSMNGGMQGMNMSGMGMPNMNMGNMNMMGSPSNVQSVQFPGLNQQVTMQEQGNIGLIMDVFMEMTVELGRTRKLIKEILGMGEGTIIELDKLAGEPVDILVNHKLIAKGEVVVIDENFGVRVTEIVSPLERMNEMG
ncbi:MAG: flagellar motor switch protein FliN [Treponema sp.]|jgi:flagellar motor switch protein FliN/FliY|nr:flagellar motor switch protein FliN [Treponema sp.]